MMGKINVGRWIMGGLVAGVIVNISETVLNMMVLKKPWEDAMKAMGKPMAMSPANMVCWIMWGFVFGLAAVWIYCGIRPRFGAGAGTAMKAGFVAWLLANFLSSVGMANMGMFPINIIAISSVWGLAESLIATTVGAWIYKEA